MAAPGKSAELAAAATARKFELIGRVAAGLAHELNGPIGIALGFTELAKESLQTAGSAVSAEEAGKLRQYLDMVESSGTRARVLARNIWNFAKDEPGAREDFDLAEAVQYVSDLTTPALKVHQIEIIRRPENEDAPPVRALADRPLFVQALVELMLSSPEAVPGGGTIYWETGSGNGAGAGFTLVAEPWKEDGGSQWPVTDELRHAFEAAGGAVNDAVQVDAPPGVTEDGKSDVPLTAWKITGSLPAGSGETGND